MSELDPKITTKHYTNILQVIHFASQSLLTTGNWDANLKQTLQYIVQTLSCCRAYIFKNNIHDDYLTMECYSQETNGLSNISNLRSSKINALQQFTHWQNHLNQGDAIYGCVKDFQATEQQWLQQEDIVSIAIVPIFVSQTWWGWLGVDNCSQTRNWEAFEIESLKTLAALFSIAIQHRQTKASFHEKSSRLYYLTHHDTLTLLPNRQLFQDHLYQTLTYSQDLQYQVAILFLDLDRFKKINDSLGHEVGDLVLRMVATRLRQQIKAEDVVARLGGDEFVIVLEEHSKDIRHVASEVAKKLLTSLSDPIQVKDYELFITTSIGISLFPEHGADMEYLMKCADSAMYKVKEQGGDHYCIYTPDINARGFELLLLESHLRRALEQQEFVVYYQPQFCLKTQKLIGMEALIRWEHPEQGMISPADFIPLAEEVGLIVPLGEWVLQTACQQNKQWQRQGFDPVMIAVNLSAKQFSTQNLIKTVSDVLDKTALPPHLLELEITESVLMDNAETAVMILDQMKAMGVGLAVDDFGTGYSSLSYLKRFPVDKLKIDRAFVHEITIDQNDAAIVDAIIQLGRSMKLSVIAEGVETQSQAEFLNHQGCDQGQGFLWGGPVPAKEFERFFKI